MPRKRNLLHFLHRCHGFKEMSKITTRTKVLQGRLAKTQKRKKTPDPLQILAKASLAKDGTWLGTPSPNFKKFGENFVICEFFVQFTGFGHLKRRAPRAAVLKECSEFWKLGIFGKGMQREKLPILGRSLILRFEPPKAQNTSKKWLSAHFLSCRKWPWEKWFLRGQNNSKFINSTWDGKYTDQAFQWAILHLIWTSGTHSKVAAKVRGRESQGARMWELTLPELTFLVKKHCFDYGWLFLLVDDG